MSDPTTPSTVPVPPAPGLPTPGLPAPGGTVERGPAGDELVVTRTFHAAADDVWASLTEPDRLARWIGYWEGDPATGHVEFFMTAESDDPDPEEYRITRCEPPHRFAGVTSSGDQTWHLSFELSEQDGVTTLTFRQLLGPGDDARNVGPGWEYYLDRLVAVREGRDAATVPWEPYLAGLADHYGRAAGAV
ncbi:SRPBCC family protein [Cellulosimicrobium cellulans]|uniref:SRPBCC family protein n=1 Tax=Cellulosimicrobium cellulans TaxID=1710 RepID=UPI0018845BE7|nr:SRPBCC family protein [Cellulosimicrobium cellulans]MBE9925882.1 SRPBCC family protein [Cellulosimicrobium cellulans]